LVDEAIAATVEAERLAAEAIANESERLMAEAEALKLKE